MRSKIKQSQPFPLQHSVQEVQTELSESSHTFTSNETLGRVISFYDTSAPLQLDHICVTKVSSYLSQMTAGLYAVGIQGPTSEILPELGVMHSKCLTRLPLRWTIPHCCETDFSAVKLEVLQVLACQMWNIQQEP